jgi:hypothetical protein
MTERSARSRGYLVASDDEQPRVRLEPGKRYDVVLTPIVDSDLQALKEETEQGPAARPPRLCGSRSTCLAIVEIE